MAVWTRAIPALTSLKTEESITAMLAGPATRCVFPDAGALVVVGLVCACVMIVSVAIAATAKVMRNVLIA